LIAAEHRLAMMLNVPVKPINVLKDPTFIHPTYMPDEVSQWRVLFYFDKLEIIDSAAIAGQYSLAYRFLEHEVSH
jgi:hypothetical protein